VPKADRIVLDPSVGMRDIIIEYLAATGAYDADPLASWRFAALRGASARFATAPCALELMDGVAGRGVAQADAVDDDGFMVCTLTL